ncbi:MAG: hypothetical protein FWD25_09825 [Clostridia bacterium]|nr:hypothetical protein [Clostridia bacterium]
MNKKCGQAAALVAVLLLIPAFAVASASADVSLGSRYVVELTARVQGFELNAIELLIGGDLIEVQPDTPLRLDVRPGEALTVSLPTGVPLGMEIEADFARRIANGYVLEPHDNARVELTLAPLERGPGIRLSAQNQILQAGDKVRQEIVLTNSALIPRQVELRYLPDAVRFALNDAEAAGYHHRLADGTLCWRLTLPAATWEGRGRAEPSTTVVSFDRTVLPLPLDQGFADIGEAWMLLWDGLNRSGQWRAQVVAPIVDATLAADRNSARAGDLIRFALRITNSGGAAKPLVISVTLPKGFRYEPEGSGIAPEEVGGVLLWRVDVSAAHRDPDGRVLPGELELHYALRMETDALNETEGLREQAFSGWVNGKKLDPAWVTLTAPLISARQSLSAQRAAVGEVVTLRMVFENGGGAEGTARWMQVLPEGLVYLPEPGENLPDIDEQGRLMWEVDVPAAGLGVIEREIRLQVADLALVNRRGGQRGLFLRASVNGRALPLQTLNIICPDITVRVFAERAALTPGALCVMKLQVTNRGGAGAPVILEIEIPDGFAEASATIPSGARREGRKLSWRLEAPPADASGPAIIEVTYPLHAEALPRNLDSHVVTHDAVYTVAQGMPQKAISARTEIGRPRPLSLFSEDGVLIAVASVLLLGTVAVFLLLLLRREPEE